MLKFILLASSCVLFLTACDDEQDKDFAELYENQQKWESLNESKYQMEYQYSAFSADAGTYTVYVEQETVQGALFEDLNEYKEQDHFIFELATVSNLFSVAEYAIANAEEFEIQYHSEFGYPTSISIDYSTDYGDDEVTHTISDLIKGSDSICNEYAAPAVSLEVTLAGNPKANTCDAQVYLEEGDYIEKLDSCYNNTFSGAWERAGTYDITVSYPDYISQTIESITVYPFICHVGTVSTQIELMASKAE